MSNDHSLVAASDVSGAERKGCRLGFLSWFWSAGAWASLFLALLGWLACVGLVLGIPNAFVRWFAFCGTWVVDVGSFIVAAMLSIVVLFTYIGVVMVGFSLAMVSHGVGVVTGAGTVLMPGASPWARLSGVFPLGAHIGGAIIGLHALLFTGPNDPANAPPVTAPSEQVDTDATLDVPEGTPPPAVEPAEEESHEAP